LRHRAFGNAAYPSLLATGTVSRSGSLLRIAALSAKATAREFVAWGCSDFSWYPREGFAS